MMKNKTFKRVLCLLLVTVMAFAGLVGCDRGTQETSSGTSGEKLDLSGKMMDLIRDGSTEFVIVRNKEGSDYETDVAIDLKTRLEKITGAPVKLTNDTKEARAHEIQIGHMVNREEAKKINDNLAANEYAVVVDNGKLIITGGDDKSMKKAYELFLEQVLECKWSTKLEDLPSKSVIQIPEKLNFKSKYMTREEFMAHTQLIEYPSYPKDQIKWDYDYEVTVTQGEKTIKLPVYNPTCNSNYFNASLIDGDVHRRFCEFAFSGDPVTVEVKVNLDFSSYVVMPTADGIPSTCEGNVIRFTLDKPNEVVLRLNQDMDTQLILFAEEPLYEDDIPNKGFSTVTYFEAGYHEVEGGVVNVPAGGQVYLEPGALVRARVIMNSSDSSIGGRGSFIEPSPNRMAVESKEETASYMLTVSGGKNNTVSGVKFLDAHTFNIVTIGASDLTIDNVKVISNQISTDGVSIWSKGTNLLVKNSFFMVSDNIFVYGGGTLDGVTVENCTLGSDYAIFFPQGNITGEGMTFRNCDVFRAGSFLKQDLGGVGDATLPMCLIENIRAEDAVTIGNIFNLANHGAGEKKYILRNISLPAEYGKVMQVAADVTGADITIDNVWLGDRQMSADSGLNLSVPAGNTVTVTANSDKAAAGVGVYKEIEVTPYQATKVYVAGQRVPVPVQPYEENGTYYVSAYEIVKELDFKDVTLDVEAGKLTFKDDSREYEETAANGNVMKDGSLMVPLSFFADRLGTTASYDAGIRRITVNMIPRSGNLLRNGDMEQGMTDDWVTRWFSPMYLSEDAHSGKYAMRYYVTQDSYQPGSANGIYQDVANVFRKYGAGVYELSCWVRKANSVCDATEVEMGLTKGYSPESTKTRVKLTDDWQQIKYTLTVGNESANWRVAYYYVGYADGTVKNILIDDMQLVKVQ